jgi:hypothetical protein
LGISAKCPLRASINSRQAAVSAAYYGLIAYFVLAIAAHIRADDLENLATPAVIELLAVAALVLRLATA